MRKRYHIGRRKDYPWLNFCPESWDVFLAAGEVTEKTHGHLYHAAIGPFRDRRAAEYAKSCGGLGVTEANRATKRVRED